MISKVLPIYSLWSREIVRFYRQPSRVVGALGSPLVFWLLIGSGVGSSFAGSSGGDYLQYFYPGTLFLILLFTAIFSTISLIQDRREGFLQSVLVAPVSRLGLVTGKILGGATLACSQGILFLLFAPLMGIHQDLSGWLLVLAVLFLNSVALTALGFVIAWRLHSIQGFHAVMNLLLIPLWLLSGALFPPEGSPAWIQIVMKLNPLRYGLAALRTSLYDETAAAPPLGLCVIVTVVFGIALMVFAAWVASRGRAEDVR
ncbi:MAG: ABC transporter permease [Candidatus Omnitrophota bacterium]|nr:ABC transporter permease [Candidatus Omnitrophota bacterium]